MKKNILIAGGAGYIGSHVNKELDKLGYDTIVLDMGNEADDQLYRQLKGRVKEIYRIGDCVAPRGIGVAILEAARTGEML